MIETEDTKHHEYLESIMTRTKNGLAKKMSFDEAYRLSNQHLMQGAMSRSVPMVEKGLIYGLVAMSILKSKEKEDDI